MNGSEKAATSSTGSAVAADNVCCRRDGFVYQVRRRNAQRGGRLLEVFPSRRRTPRPPDSLNGQDINDGQSDVVLIYKNSTWTTPSGRSGEMETHAPVVSRGSFVASGGVAMLVLKSGNVLGATTGVVFDDLTVGGDSQPLPPPLKLNQEPSAAVSASPTSGNPPLTVTFDASSSSEPDGDPLPSAWDFGDGRQGSGVGVSHTFASAGTFVTTLTLDDGRGGSDSSTLKGRPSPFPQESSFGKSINRGARNI